MAALFLVGAAVGSAVNLFVDRLRMETPRKSPFNKPFERLMARWFSRGGRAPGRSSRQAPSSWVPWLPILGWYARRQEKPLADGSWRRPCFVEFLAGAAFAGLYFLEVGYWRLVPNLASHYHQPPVGNLTPFDLNLYWVVHLAYLSHVLLLTLLLAASLIDLDEWIIPDAITVPGTLAALLLATAIPTTLLYTGRVPFKEGEDKFVSLAAPSAWPSSLDQRAGLVLALACVWTGCFALLPRVLYLRRGVATGLRLFARRIVRSGGWTLSVLATGLAVTAVVVPVWFVGGVHWRALLTALVGMAVGGGVIWVVRIVCSTALRREAMGFGDVTLMAMIGAFLGWQASVLVFFVSPFFGLIPPLVALVGRDKVPAAMPFGPFLCLGAATVLLCWAQFWPWAEDVIRVANEVIGNGWIAAAYLVGTLVGTLALMVALLLLIQGIKRRFGWEGA